MSRLLRMDLSGHTELAAWSAGDSGSYDRAATIFDEQLAGGIRSVAAPIRDGAGTVIAAMNVTVHAAETSVEVLVGDFLPLLLTTASEVSADFARYESVPHVTARSAG